MLVTCIYLTGNNITPLCKSSFNFLFVKKSAALKKRVQNLQFIILFGHSLRTFMYEIEILWSKLHFILPLIWKINMQSQRDFFLCWEA